VRHTQLCPDGLRVRVRARRVREGAQGLDRQEHRSPNTHRQCYRPSFRQMLRRMVTRESKPIPLMMRGPKTFDPAALKLRQNAKATKSQIRGEIKVSRICYQSLIFCLSNPVPSHKPMNSGHSCAYRSEPLQGLLYLYFSAP
jgi:hypothetical protein